MSAINKLIEEKGTSFIIAVLLLILYQKLGYLFVMFIRLLILISICVAIFFGLYTQTEPRYYNICRSYDLKKCDTSLEFTLIDTTNFTVKIDDSSAKPQFDVNTIAIQTADLGLIYRLPHLIRSQLIIDKKCSFEGGLLPYLQCNGSAGRFDGFHLDVTPTVIDNSKEIELALVNQTSIVLARRYAFHLALHYEGKQNYQRALYFYQSRVKMAGWNAEIFYAQYRVGYCYMMLEKKKEAKESFLDAYSIDPTRKEPLYFLARLAREEKDYPLSLLYSGAAMQLGATWDDALHVSKDIYYWIMEDERALCLSAIGRKLDAQWHWNRLLQSGSLPANQIDRIKKNLSF